MHMIPYEKPFYFIILGILLIPQVLMLTRGKRSLIYQTFLTIFFLWISFFSGPSIKQGIALILFLVYQCVLVKGYLAYRLKKNNSGVFYLMTILAILPLALLKIFPLFHIDHSLLGFLGISYLTFKSVQMVLEIRDGILKEVKLSELIQFIIFFPTISSGPIDRFRRFQKDLTTPIDTEKYLKMVDKGIFFLFLGFLYKYLIGLNIHDLAIGPITYNIRTGDHTFLTLLQYMYAYGFYLFFDFAGYSLFAVGTSYLLGYETPMNFHFPFRSENIKEFWNRWHMTLSFWFRDYVYMRLTYLLVKKKWFKSRIVISNISYLGLFLLMGLWHGLTWYYIVYGLYMALLIIINDAWLRFKKKRKDKLPSNTFTRGLSIFITFHAVMFGFLIFSGIFNTIWFK